ncbi:hypothetical protein [Breoghania sp.]|uniref:hypothetical protein n=1 Tax=Breoghania sp. TaxID=2065378 RepID=UPI0026023354|nr:hypothetical protein [Breoghania sp.]MDJ0932030.1 hypothetical protein [Breoghania sp.]
MPVENQFATDFAIEPLRQFRRQRIDVTVQRHDDELVAAEPRGDDIARRIGGNVFADRTQHRIAHRMPERVVDALEAIEVDEQHDHAKPLGLCLQQHG